MPTPVSEGDLVRRARRGHKAAFGEFVLRHRQPVLATTRHGLRRVFGLHSVVPHSPF